MRHLVNPLAIALFFAAFAQAAVEEFVVDKDHSKIGFEVNHLVVSTVEGVFKKFDGKMQFDPDTLEKTTLEGTIDVTSIDTGTKKRDDHLRSPDFFDAVKYSQVKFKSKKVVKAGDKAFKMTGDLTMRNVTKEVTLDGTFKGIVKAYDKRRAAFKLTGQINRLDYGMKFNDLVDVGPVVGKEVTLNLSIEAIAKKDLN